jgi:hypothetical protein
MRVLGSKICLGASSTVIELPRAGRVRCVPSAACERKATVPTNRAQSRVCPGARTRRSCSCGVRQANAMTSCLYKKCRMGSGTGHPPRLRNSSGHGVHSLWAATLGACACMIESFCRAWRDFEFTTQGSELWTFCTSTASASCVKAMDAACTVRDHGSLGPALPVNSRLVVCNNTCAQREGRALKSPCTRARIEGLYRGQVYRGSTRGGRRGAGHVGHHRRMHVRVE